DMLLDLGVPEKEIVYKEHPWIGGGNAGPSLEVNVRGLEVATLVFMNMENNPEGKIELVGDMYKPLNLNVVDTGYGVERWAWMSDGAPTIYDSLFPNVIDKICEKAGVEHPIDEDWYRKMLEEYTKLASRYESDFRDEKLIVDLIERLSKDDIQLDKKEIIDALSKLQYVYTIADHSKTIALMLSDGIVPSNVEEGYLVRMMIRRTLRHIDRFDSRLSLKEFVEMQMDNFSEIIDNDSKELVFDILENEIEKYHETLERGSNLVKRELKDLEKEELSIERLIEFYDTHGIHPTIVKELAQDYEVNVEVPDNFNSMLAEKHEGPEKKEIQEEQEVYDLPDTRQLYYENQNTSMFEAVVLHSEEDKLILDQTLFYPEGGGQPSDKGVIISENKRVHVKNVRREGGVILHEVDGFIPKGEAVEGKIDWERRMNLTRHHTATHIIISSARKVLGKHIWQRGAQKGVDNARIDLSHYKRISREEVKQIEKLANKMVLEGIPVKKEELTRDEAEERFGFELYQGGVPQSDIIRVVHISDIHDYDAQACGGTHVNNTSEVGAIKILNTQRIQDGVERIIFSAGMATVEEFQKQEDILLKVSDVYSVPTENLPETADRFFREWKERGKEIEKLKKYKAIAVAEELIPGEKLGDVEIISSIVEMETKEMLSIAERLTSEENRIVLLASSGDKPQLVFSRSDNLDFNMSYILEEAAKEINGGGGGSPKTAQGGGIDPEGREAALEKGKKLILNNL
ncbi:MAG: alanine--tRNA ligase, partial [Thermoplasmatota archaeon]